MARLTPAERTALRALAPTMDAADVRTALEQTLDALDDAEGEVETHRVRAVTSAAQLADANAAIDVRERAGRVAAVRHVLNNVLAEERNESRTRAMRGRGDPDLDAEKRALDRFAARLNAWAREWDHGELGEG